MLCALLNGAMLLHAADKKPAPPPKPVTASKPAAAARKPAATNGTKAGPAAGTHTTFAGPAARGPIANAPTTTSRTASGTMAARPALSPRGTTERTLRSGQTVSLRPDGRPRDIRDVAHQMQVHRELGGGRRVMVDRPDHSRTFFERGRPGYVQRPFAFRGHEFARRTYIYHGRVYSHFYRAYPYRGLYLHVYAPVAYYPRAYYAWAYRPWGSPVVYSWGYADSPWYGYYGYYFVPAPAYASAPEWLTDYMISADLQQAYAAQADLGGAPPAAETPASAGPMLTPEIKQQIAAEVRNQIALENQEAQLNAAQADIDPGSSGIDRLLNDKQAHIFVVGSPLDVVDATETECSLSEGDVLALQGPSAPNAQAASLVVLASKGAKECGRQATVTVALEDLQEMQNHMRATIDQGLEDLKTKQGQDGLPPLPPAAQQAQAQAQYAPLAPPSDPDAAAEIQQQADKADQLEKDASAELSASHGN